MHMTVLSVPNHDGSARRVGEGFFGPSPPSEIGTLLSASTDKTKRLRLRQFAQRFVLFSTLAPLIGMGGFLAGGAIGAALQWCCVVPDRVEHAIQAMLIVTAVGIVALEIWTRNECSYVGSEGISRTTRSWRGLDVQTIRFSEVAWLRVSQTRVRLVGAPGHTTNFGFTWSDGMEKDRFRISGSYGEDTLLGNESCDEPEWNPVHFALAAERAWTRVMLAQARATLDEGGACEFPTFGREMIVVSNDAIVIRSDVAATELPVCQVKHVTVSDGVLEIELVRARRGFFTDDGVLKRDVCWIANFQVLYQVLAHVLSQGSITPAVELDRDR